MQLSAGCSPRLTLAKASFLGIRAQLTRSAPTAALVSRARFSTSSTRQAKNQIYSPYVFSSPLPRLLRT